MDNSSNSSPVHIILGATGGIGSALCRRLSESGARLVIAARDRDRLDKLAGETGAHPVALDAIKTGEVDRLLAEAIQEFGRVDGTATCVGSFMLKPAHLTTDDELTRTISLNLNTAFGTVRAAVKHIPEAGSVVLISSVAGQGWPREPRSPSCRQRRCSWPGTLRRRLLRRARAPLQCRRPGARTDPHDQEGNEERDRPSGLHRPPPAGQAR